jgi:hypothetical protein
MKKTRKKLILNRETIARLTDNRLFEAAGATGIACPTKGITNCNCPTNTCDTLYECPTHTGCIETYNC